MSSSAVGGGQWKASKPESNAECSPLLAGSDGEIVTMMRNLGL